MTKKHKRSMHKRIRILKKLFLGMAMESTIKPEEWTRMFTAINTVARTCIFHKNASPISTTVQLLAAYSNLKGKYYLLHRNYRLLNQRLRITERLLRNEKNRSDVFYAKYWGIHLKLISVNDALSKGGGLTLVPSLRR